MATASRPTSKPSKFTIHCANPAAAKKAFADVEAVVDGVMLARDLVNEPANMLGPVEFAAQAKELEKLGVKVEILTEKEMKKLGMGALLGVAQGSPRGRRGWWSCSGTAARPRTSRSPSSARASSSIPAAFRSSRPPAWKT